ncbi:MAG: hypothetical protein ACR2FN_08690 [Chitinophagaceae bacterium]
MYKKKPEIDITDKVLDACYKAYPDKIFIQSLMHQYEERGSLSKKQLQGLHQVAVNVKDLPTNWLATLEASILKMPTRYKSALTEHTPLYIKDEQTGKLIIELLQKYPQHKRVLFLQSKYENNEPLSSTEITELQKFKKLLL